MILRREFLFVVANRERQGAGETTTIIIEDTENLLIRLDAGFCYFFNIISIVF